MTGFVSLLATLYSLYSSLATGNWQRSFGYWRQAAPGYWLLALCLPTFADCFPFAAAADHLGEVACIKGKVVNVVVSPTGLHFLNFCEDYTRCPFTVVVFPRDLRGDIQGTEGINNAEDNQEGPQRADIPGRLSAALEQPHICSK